jgi:hypothetical protein
LWKSARDSRAIPPKRWALNQVPVAIRSAVPECLVLAKSGGASIHKFEVQCSPSRERVKKGDILLVIRFVIRLKLEDPLHLFAAPLAPARRESDKSNRKTKGENPKDKSQKIPEIRV